MKIFVKSELIPKRPFPVYFCFKVTFDTPYLYFWKRDDWENSSNHSHPYDENYVLGVYICAYSIFWKNRVVPKKYYSQKTPEMNVLESVLLGAENPPLRVDLTLNKGGFSGVRPQILKIFACGGSKNPHKIPI